MGKKDILNFIDSIPNDKLKTLPTLITSLYCDDTFRCDMQGVSSSVPSSRCRVLYTYRQTQMTSGKPRNHNIQVQVNNNPKISSFRKMAPNTVAGPVLVPEDGSGGFTAAKIKQELKDKIVVGRPLRGRK